jgi:hypothetical protein
LAEARNARWSPERSKAMIPNGLWRFFAGPTIA